MKRRHWIILAALIVAMLVLSGCGVPMEGVDVTTQQPDGPWQTFVVWPLANILIWIAVQLQQLGVVYAWGFAIILFTLAVKVLTFPLSLTQIRGMQAQKELQPRLQELQKKYGKDRERLSQEQMKLYQEAGVNPLSGCLPLVIQMPILFGLYAALVAVGPLMVNAGFFWIPDLSYPQYSMGMSWIPALWQAGDYQTLIAYLVLPVLLVVTQFVMQKWMTPTPAGDGAAAGMTQNMSLVMTLMFGYFTLMVPAGLTLYWVTSNVLQMIQQWGVTRYLTKPSTVAALPAGDSASMPVTVDSTVEKPKTTANAPKPAANTPKAASPSKAKKGK